MTATVMEKPKATRPPRRPAQKAPAGTAPSSRSSQAARPAAGARPWPFARRVTEKELFQLCQHLAALTGSGIGLADCLRSFANEAPQGTLRRVLEEVINDIEAGRKLSDALNRRPEHFSAYFRASIWAGEASGNMVETLERLARYLENKQETRQRIRNAFAYPLVLMLVIVGVVTFLMMYVVPVFAGVYTRMGIQLPLPTQALIRVSTVLVTEPWIPAAPVALVLVAAIYARRNRTARLWVDRWKVRLPIVGPLLRQIVLYRFSRAMGEIMGAGVLVLDALDLAGRVTGNEAFIADLEPVRQDVQRGLGLTEPLRRTGWFPPSLLQVISSGEKSGRVPTLLIRTSDILQRDMDLTLKRVVGQIEPLLTVVMAFVVGVILLAVYLPMFDVMQQVGK